MNTNNEPKRRTQKIKGVEYVYEDYPYWDKKTKQNRHKREYIGKVGEDGEFIPNKKYLARQNEPALKGGAVPAGTPARRVFFGATHLLDEISEITGIREDLQACFPNSYKAIMSLAYYLVLESESPMYRFPRWSFDHRHPWGEELSSQRISEVLREIPEQAKLEFFKRQSRRRQEKEYLAAVLKKREKQNMREQILSKKQVQASISQIREYVVAPKPVLMGVLPPKGHTTPLLCWK